MERRYRMGVFRKNENWWIDFRDCEGKRRREKIGPVFKTAKEALNMKLDQTAREKLYGKVTQTPAVSFEAMSEKYLTWSKTNKRSCSRDELSLKHLKTHFAGKRLCDINPFLVEGYKAKRRGEVSPRTVNIELACLRHVFNKAIEWEFATINPVKKVRLFRENNQRTRFLSREECDRLIECCADHLKPLVTVALNTGMRRGELLALTWEDIDIPNGLIQVRTSKSGEGRQIPMNEAAKKTLNGLKEKVRKASGHVFFTHLGKPLRDPRVGFEQALKRAGIAGATFHTLRHTFASNLVMGGVDLKTVQELLGHKTFSMTLRYSHLSQSHKRDAVRVLDGHYLDTDAKSGTGEKAVSA
jgi:integrase